METKKDNVFCNTCFKGGVGKSQITFEQAAWLAMRGNRVLVIDADPQANVTDRLCGGESPNGRYLPEILLAGDGIQPGDIQTRIINGYAIDYVPANAYLTRIESRMKAVGTPKEYIMRAALAGIVDNYDYILIDTPPSGELISIASMIAANKVVIPALADKASVDGVEVMVRTVQEIAANQWLNPGLQIAGIIVGRYHNTIANRHNTKLLKDNYGDLVIMPVIRECTKVQQAIDADIPVLFYDPQCSAANDYEAVFSHLFKK